ncbi:hypothetical protein HZS_1595, partial [Henneguya salminicola]
MLELNQLSSLTDLKLYGNPICYVSGYRNKICSILPLSLMRSNNFRLDGRKLSSFELKLLATHPSNSPLISKLTLGTKISSDNAFDLVKSSDKFHEPVPLNNESIDTFTRIDSEDTLDMKESEDEAHGKHIKNSSFHSFKSCLQSLSVSSTNTPDIHNPLTENSSVKKSTSIIINEASYYSVKCLNLSNDDELSPSFIKFVCQDLVEFTHEKKKICELDLRYLLTFEFDEKYVIKMAFELHNPNKKYRAYIIQENHNRFNILCRKLSLYNRNYLRKLKDAHDSISLNFEIVCSKCNFIVNSSLSTICPKCNSSLSLVKVTQESFKNVDIIKLISSECVNKIDPILISYLENRIFSKKIERFKLCFKCWYADKNTQKYILCLIAMSDSKFYVLRIVDINSDRSDLQSQLYLLFAISLIDIKKICLRFSKYVLKISKKMTHFIFISDSSILSNLMMEIECISHFFYIAVLKSTDAHCKISIELDDIENPTYQ